MIKLFDWYIESVEEEFFVAQGYVSGHQKLSDGTHIHTSKIMAVREDAEKQGLFVDTFSGNTYCFKKQDINSERLSMTNDCLTKLGLPEFCRDAVRCLEQAKAEKLRDADTLLSDNELLLLMDGVACLGAYFKNADGVHELDIRYHVGMFQDSVLCSKVGVADFRYYPKNLCEMGMESYHASSNMKRIYIKNIGGTAISFNQEIICKAESVTQIERQHFLGEGLLSPDMYNGESLLSQLAEWEE